MTRIGSQAGFRTARALCVGLALAPFLLVFFGSGACKKREGYLKDDISYFREHLKPEMDYDDIIEEFGVPPVDLNAASAESDGLHIYQYPLYDSTFIRIGYTRRMEYACWVDYQNNLVEDVVVIKRDAD